MLLDGISSQKEHDRSVALQRMSNAGAYKATRSPRWAVWRVCSTAIINPVACIYLLQQGSKTVSCVFPQSKEKATQAVKCAFFYWRVSGSDNW